MNSTIAAVPAKIQKNLRLKEVTVELIRLLADKLDIDEASVVGMAVRQLAERQDIAIPEQKPDRSTESSSS